MSTASNATVLSVSYIGSSAWKKKEVWQTSLSKIELIQQLRTVTEPIEEFRLVSRLSGAGIVVRALEIPQTDKPLIGKVSDKEIVIAQTLDPVNISPYQPMVTVVFQDSSVELTFRPHPDVYLLSPVEWLGWSCLYCIWCRWNATEPTCNPCHLLEWRLLHFQDIVLDGI